MALPDADARRAAAESFEADIALSAGAGSGKTEVLISRYLAILERRLADVPQIVAVTFTEKAAAEMRNRIRARCRKRAREAAAEEERRRWQRHERDLEAAPVSTIHSLCARILHEHAIAAVLDPQFRVLEQAPAALLMAESVQEHVLRRVRDGAETMRQLVAAYGVGRLCGILCELLQCSEKWLDKAVGPESADSFEQSRLAAGAEAQGAALDDLLQNAAWGAAIGVLESTHPLKPDDLAVQRRAAILEHAAAAADEGLAFEQRVQALRELRSHCRSAGQQRNWPSPEALEAVKGAFVKLRGLYEKAMAEALGAGDAEVAESSARLSAALAIELTGAHAACHTAKRRRSFLDFADLQLEARRLLRERPDICKQYQDQFAYVMVDEFQDTNALQKDILFSLAGGTPGKLFIVGDDKQSIYRFRGADVSVFNLTRDEFSRADGARNLGLSVNFRSQPGLVSFYNHLFADDAVMGIAEPPEPYIARYSPLDAHRTVRPEGADVEILLAKADSVGEEADEEAAQATLDALRETEAAAIARRIEEICDAASGLQVFDPDRDDSEGPRRATYGDIAILFRALTDVRTYERALRQRGIPYYLVAGQGLYRRQEIRDLLSLLRALENARDEVALVGALRSPLFSLSDETLYWLCRHDHPYRALQRLAEEPDHGQFAHVGADERDKAIRAARILHGLRGVKDRLSISQLLASAVEQTGLVGALLAQFNGEQMASNVRKLIDLAAGFERGGLFSLHEFIAYLQDLIVTEQREPEAPVQAEREDVVKLLTIHRAKGLQWPIVIVPDLVRVHGSRDSAWLWHHDYGLVVKGEDSAGNRKWPAVGQRAKKLDEDMETAEHRRLLYVACTRARDHLILSSPWKPGKEGRPASGSWIAWIAEALDIDSDTPDGSLAAASGNGWAGEVRTSRPEVEQPTPRTHRRETLASRYESELTGGKLLPGAAGQRDLEARAGSLRAAMATRERFTVTELATYVACPRQYELRYVRDLPEYFLPSPSRGAALLSPLERGTVAHRCLQRIGREHEEDVERVVIGCLREFGLAPVADEALRRDMAEMVTRFLQTDLFQRIRSAVRLRTEAPFAMPLEGSIIEGQVDAAAWDTEGAIHLIDYKTGAGDRRATERYRFQLALYCAAIEAAFGTPPASATLYQLEQAESQELRLPEEMKEAVAKARSAIEGIRALAFPAREGDWCAFCGHGWTCGNAGPYGHQAR